MCRSVYENEIGYGWHKKHDKLKRGGVTIRFSPGCFFIKTPTLTLWTYFRRHTYIKLSGSPNQNIHVYVHVTIIIMISLF